jgi:hypothetical protein
LALFHAVVLERIHFGSIGFNIPYEFNPSDFAISRRHLRMFLSDGSGEVPFEALSYVIGQLNYGGRVTDSWDRRVLLSLLNRYFTSESLDTPYAQPPLETLSGVEQGLTSWPHVTAGEDVGLAKNASTITARAEAVGIINSLLEIQPTLVAATGVASEEQFALQRVGEILAEVPAQFPLTLLRGGSLNFDDAVDVVLKHEVLLYNELLGTMRESLEQLQRGLKGLIVVDERLELLNRRLLANRVPEWWLEVSFPSILGLRGYLTDVRERIAFIDEWLRQGRPARFRLGAFYHPEEFLTACLQVYARRHKVPFDTLSFATEPVDGEAAPEAGEGVLVEGLFLEGAKWRGGEGVVACEPTELLSTLPLIRLRPSESKASEAGVYVCPLYRTQARGSGALPGFLMSLQLPTRAPADVWVQRSVALFVTATA